MSSNAPYVTAAVTVGVLGSAYFAYRAFWNTKRRIKIPESWSHAGTLTNVYVYPIKSCGPVLVDEIECSLLGPRKEWLRDRTLMLVDRHNNFISARVYPELLTVHPSVQGSVLTMKHRDMETINVNLADIVAIQKPVKATVWGTEVPVLECGYEAQEWFSRLLNRTSDSFRLVLYASQQCRTGPASASALVFRYTDNDYSALADQLSYNIICESSVDDLNSRIQGEKVTHLNFRPNFVLKGNLPAFSEDNWTFIKIGDNVFEVVRPCTRCTLTTMDPETGIRSVNNEPLNTLKNYRQVKDPELRRYTGNSPRMGVQLALRSTPGGHIRVGDNIYYA